MIYYLGVTFTEQTMMSEVMDEEIKRWTARRSSALVLEIIRGQSSVGPDPGRDRELGRDGKRGVENALRTKLEDVRDQSQCQLKDLQGANGEPMLEIRA
ncbi:DUF1153 domain-containing protein [Stenotrophomonas sp. TWI809]|uniref:DUF1153 domain-containing protein n=2 Tax=Stenotrophomonas TaxID=40323 RepID=UPI003209CF18